MSESAIKLLSDAGSDALDDDGARETYRRRGYLCLTGALSATACREVIESLRGASMIDVRSRDLRGNSRFLTLNGGDLVSRVQWLRDDYLNLARKVSKVVGEPVVGLDNEKVGLSLNYTPPGGGFVPHFDRNAYTVSLYLNDVDDGELAIWPNIVSPLLDLAGDRKLGIALRLSRFKRAISIPPRQGTLVIFSRRTVHSVKPVTGDKSRVSVIMAFDRPGVSFREVPDYYGIGHDRVVLDELAV